MRKINIKLASFIAIVAITFTSCEEYIDVNKDPNNPEVSELTPDNILPGALSTTAITFSTRMNQVGNIMSASWAANATDFTSPFDNEFRYNLSTTFYQDVWDNLYLNTSNLSHIERFNDGKNWDYHKAISKITKAFYFQYLVDLYGDLPYSQIHNGTNNLFPKYDDDKQVYRNLITEIDEAIALINDTNPDTVRDVSIIDVMMHGDMDKWIRFANTLKLRILLRQSNLTDSETTTYLTQQFANLAGEDFIDQDDDVTLNPGYINSDGKQNPYYALFGRDPQGDRTNTNNLVGPTVFLARYLEGTLAGRSILDPRRLRQFASRSALAPTTITGVLQGATSGRPSRLGPGVLKESAQDLILMQSSESLFLQAEAIHKGYLAGDAKQKFESAIEASFTLLGLTSSAAATYIANSQNTNTIGWDGSPNKLEAIITQKWIANNSINGIESWIEMTRTGFPSGAPLSSSTSETKRPIRLLYPASEYAGNSNNVPSQTKSDGFNTPVFWKTN